MDAINWVEVGKWAIGVAYLLGIGGTWAALTHNSDILHMTNDDGEDVSGNALMFVLFVSIAWPAFFVIFCGYLMIKYPLSKFSPEKEKEA